MRRFLLIGACVAALAVSTSAGDKKQPKPYALIFGTVFGADEHVAQGVPVVIRRADKKNQHWDLVSDARGEFAQRVPAGTADYVVEPHLKDKQLVERVRVKVHIENEERQDVALHLNGQPHAGKK